MDDAIDQASRWLKYRLLSRVIHHPDLLRALAKLLRSRPGFARVARIVADRDSAMAVFQRQWSFTTTQAPNMRAGEFVIGMEAGETQEKERRYLQSALLAPCAFGAAAAEASRALIDHWIADGAGQFDLIGDYLAPVAWAPLAATLGPSAARAIVEHEGGEPALYRELRAVGAQLIVGPISPRRVLDEAEECAAALNRRVRAADGRLDPRWTLPPRLGNEDVLRNAVGLMWVGHPATVQAGALCLQELFSRPGALEKLGREANTPQDAAWSDNVLRGKLGAFVLELLRRRPPFPILTRNVPRDTWFALGPDVPPGEARAGSGMTILVVGALDDAPRSDDLSGPWHVDAGYRTLMFGHGARACIAKDQVVEVLVSALIGLLRLPRLRWGSRFRRIEYDGPTIVRMPLRYGS